MLFLRSLFFSITMIISTVVVAFLLVIFLPAPFVVRSRIARVYAQFIVSSLKVLCGIHYQVKGQENIPEGAAIIYSKHQSTWETYALQVIFPGQTWVLKQELMWVPFFGWGLAALKPIAIDRSSGRKAVKQIIEKGKKRLEEGIWITIFPEGTRVAPNEYKRWGIGGAILAEHSGFPIVPVAHNAGEFWGRRKFIKQPGCIQVIIGPPVDTRGMKASEINHQVEEWMNSAMVSINPQYANIKHNKGAKSADSGPET